jgi:hypothetical protein
MRWLGALALFAFGCQSIAGIEDRHYEPSVTGTPECESYCNHVMAGCTGVNAAYPDRDTCLRTCAKLPTGETTQDNSIECRTAQAELAESTGEPESHCPGAGPYGAGVCGSTCQAYCSLITTGCPEKLVGVKDCEAECAGLRSDGVYDPSQIASGDSLECRVARATLALGNPSECAGAALKSTTCTDPAKGSPSCEDICNLVDAACTGTDAPYESHAQCLKVCGALPIGTNDDQSGNTAACRKYHAYNAMAAASQHCPHTGPGGDGHCGKDNCESYCLLLPKTCPAAFAATFGSDASKCNTECEKLPGAGLDQWKSAPATGVSARCRLINVARAAEQPDDATFCAAAVGGGECQ